MIREGIDRIIELYRGPFQLADRDWVPQGYTPAPIPTHPTVEVHTLDAMAAYQSKVDDHRVPESPRFMHVVSPERVDLVVPWDGRTDRQVACRATYRPTQLDYPSVFGHFVQLESARSPGSSARTSHSCPGPLPARSSGGARVTRSTARGCRR